MAVFGNTRLMANGQTLRIAVADGEVRASIWQGGDEVIHSADIEALPSDDRAWARRHVAHAQHFVA